MPTSNTEELGHFLKCTVIGRGVFGPCACCSDQNLFLGTRHSFILIWRAKLELFAWNFSKI